MTNNMVKIDWKETGWTQTVSYETAVKVCHTVYRDYLRGLTCKTWLPTFEHSGYTVSAEDLYYWTTVR